MTKVKTWLNRSEFPTVGEINSGVSMTVPDEALTVKEIISRFSRGLPVGAHIPDFDEENDFPDPRTLDLTELDDYRKQLYELRKSIEADVAKARNAEVDSLKAQIAALTAKAKEMENPPAPEGTNPS